jgi:hypothetical protein
MRPALKKGPSPLARESGAPHQAPDSSYSRFGFAPPPPPQPSPLSSHYDNALHHPFFASLPDRGGSLALSFNTFQTFSYGESRSPPIWFSNDAYEREVPEHLAMAYPLRAVAYLASSDEGEETDEERDKMRESEDA